MNVKVVSILGIVGLLAGGVALVSVLQSSPAASAQPPMVEAKADEPAAASSVHVRPPACEEADEEQPPKKVQANTSRCWTCNRKIGLTGFQCKCEFWFCAEHRYTDKHECAFDYKAQGKDLLTRANPVIAPKKLENC